MEHANHKDHRKSSSAKDVPIEIRCDLNGAHVHLKRGRFLGKGSFACCFEFIDKIGEKSYAAKVISRATITDQSQNDKIVREAQIHTGLDHPNIVKLLDYFDDERNVYFMLEICSGRSLMELHTSRKTITEPEARYYLTQLVSGVQYLHENKIIHRDLKLANLLLTNGMTVKIADFGLAVRESDIERCQFEKCGTPNYISPEMLRQKGHSYPVDIWAIGIVLYILLSGIPPFETADLHETYRRIESNTYTFTPEINNSAQDLITRLLAPNPINRPLASQICQHKFFTVQNCPTRLPLSSIVATPRIKGSRTNESKVEKMEEDQPLVPALSLNANEAHNISVSTSLHNIIRLLVPFDQFSESPTQEQLEKDDEYPAGRPICWVTRWVDSSANFGIAYELNNGSIGFLFRDDTKLIIDSSGMRFQYIGAEGNENYYEFNDYPPQLQKKVDLIGSMYDFMRDLETSGKAMMTSDEKQVESMTLERWPSVLKCYIEEEPELVVAFCTSDGSLQVNFKKPHVKAIISSTLSAVTLIYEEECLTYKVAQLCSPNCPSEILLLLKRVKQIAVKMMNY